MRVLFERFASRPAPEAALQIMPNRPQNLPVWRSYLYRCPRTGQDVATQVQIASDASDTDTVTALRVRCASCKGHHHFMMARERILKIV